MGEDARPLSRGRLDRRELARVLDADDRREALVDPHGR